MVFDVFFELTSAIAIGGAVVAFFRIVQRKWLLARQAARIALLGASAAISLPALTMVLLSALGVALVDLGDDPSQRARVLAQYISEWMNWMALSFLAALIALPLWFVARRRMRASDVPPAK